MTNKKSNNFANYLFSLDKDELIYIYLNNNVCILTEPRHIQFFDDYFIYDGKSEEGTMFFPDQKKIYPEGYTGFNQHSVPHLNIVPYLAISLIAGKFPPPDVVIKSFAKPQKD